MSVESQYRYMELNPSAGVTTRIIGDRTIRTTWNPSMEQYQQVQSFHGKKGIVFIAKFKRKK